MIAPSGTCRRAAIADVLVARRLDEDLAFVRGDDRCPSGLVTTTRRSPYSTVPATFDLRAVCSAIRAAVPPMWNVRSVSCVPGSPIDCAAMMPTASPRSTIVHRRQVAAVAHAAETALRLAREHGADLDRLDARLFDLRAPSPRRSAGPLRPAACGGPTRRAHADPRHPRRRSCRRCAPTSGSITSSPSFSAETSRPWIVPQSSSVIVTSCATSTRRRVR